MAFRSFADDWLRRVTGWELLMPTMTRSVGAGMFAHGGGGPCGYGGRTFFVVARAHAVAAHRCGHRTHAAGPHHAHDCTGK
ncbi:hypothetical protein [Streptomyces sp. NPDC048521]|uniref:hypothetical protein n=1 Tax=Streptomyces sp. NPDC048521 TaxID=3365566 RepID=UPI00372007C1